MRVQKQRPGDQDGKTEGAECKRSRPGQIRYTFAKVIGSKPEHRRPDNGAGGIGHEEARPGYLIDAGKQCRQHPEKGDEAAKEHDLAAMSLKEILPDFDARLGQADIASVADEDGEADFPSDPIANIVADDGAKGCRGDDLIEVQLSGLAGIDGSCNQDRLAGQWQSHAF